MAGQGASRSTGILGIAVVVAVLVVGLWLFRDAPFQAVPASISPNQADDVEVASEAAQTSGQFVSFAEPAPVRTERSGRVLPTNEAQLTREPELPIPAEPATVKGIALDGTLYRLGQSDGCRAVVRRVSRNAVPDLERCNSRSESARNQYPAAERRVLWRDQLAVGCPTRHYGIQSRPIDTGPARHDG